MMARRNLAREYRFDARRLLILLPTCVFFLPLLFSAAGIAADIPNDSASVSSTDDIVEDEESPEITVPGVKAVNLTHLYLSSTVEKFSQRIDSFFGEERVYEESTGTYLQMRNNVIINDNGKLDYDFKLRAKLRLPQLKERFRLVIESEGERSDLSDFSQDSARSSLLGQLEDSDFSASLQYLFKETERWNISLRPGVRFSNPVEVYTKLRMSREQPLTERWLSRLTGQFGYYTDDGWVGDLRMDFERKTGERDLFRSATSGTWRESFPGNQFLVHSFSFTHVLNPNSSVLVELGLTGETRPSLHNTSYFSSVRYRRNIHRGWLFMEVRPRVAFAKENDYDTDVSLILSLEVLLGEGYSQ